MVSSIYFFFSVEKQYYGKTKMYIEIDRNVNKSSVKQSNQEINRKL